MGGGNAGRDPVVQSAQLAQLGGHGSRGSARLALQLHQVQFRHAPRRPEVSRQADLGQRPTVEVKGEALDRAGAKVPAGDDALVGDATERFGHPLAPAALAPPWGK